MRNVGLKIQPIDADIQEKYMDYEVKRGLETMLGEAGVIQKYERAYVPKKK